MFVAVLVLLLLFFVGVLAVMLVRNNRQKMAARGPYPVWQRRALRRQSGLDDGPQEPTIGNLKSTLEDNPQVESFADEHIDQHTSTASHEDSDVILGLKKPAVKTNDAAQPSDNAAAEPQQQQSQSPEVISPVQQQQLSLSGERLMVCLKAAKDCPYGGYELLQSLLANGFRFGEMDLFHRHQQKTGHGPILFSLAAATETGSFDLAKIGGFSCPGLSLFFYMGGQANPSNTFNLMLETAEHLADDLGGQLLDERQQSLTPEIIKRMRDNIHGAANKLYTPDLFETEHSET